MLKIKDIVKRHTKQSINILWLINENVFFFPLRFGVELDLPAHRAMTLTPSNTFVINWNAKCEPGLVVHIDLTKALVAQWEQIPAARYQNLLESHPRGVECPHTTNCTVKLLYIQME